MHGGQATFFSFFLLSQIVLSRHSTHPVTSVAEDRVVNSLTITTQSTLVYTDMTWYHNLNFINTKEKEKELFSFSRGNKNPHTKYARKKFLRKTLHFPGMKKCS